MKKYLLTLSSLAISLGMTHAAETALSASDENSPKTTAETVFGGGSVVDSVAAITLGTTAEPVSAVNFGLSASEPTVPAVSIEVEGSALEANNDEVEGASEEAVAPSAAVEINTAEEGEVPSVDATPVADSDADAGMTREVTEAVAVDGVVEESEEKSGGEEATADAGAAVEAQ